MSGTQKAVVKSVTPTFSGNWVIQFDTEDGTVEEVLPLRKMKKLEIMVGCSGTDMIGKEVGIYVDAAGDVWDYCRAAEIAIKKPLWERQYAPIT